MSALPASPSRVKRLLYITRSRIPSEQANSIQVMKMCAGFAAHVDVELAAPYYPADARASDSIWSRYAVPRTFRIRWLPFPHWGERFAVRGFAGAAVLYARLRGYDAAYTRDPWAAYWLARAGIRVGFEAHDLAEDRRYPVWPKLTGDASLSPSLRGVFCISQSLANAYREAGARPEILHIAPDGVDLERFQPALSKQAARRRLGLAADAMILCHSGHMYPGRGVEETLQALEKIPGVMLLLVGGKPADIERLRAQAVEARLSDRVKFVGWVPNADVPLYLWAADALVMPYTSRVPTLRSMSPLKMFEYLAAGRPIVATDFPAIREVLQDGGNAILVAPDSPSALAEGIRRTLDASPLAEKIANRAAKDAVRYAWTNRAGNILAILGGGEEPT